MDRIAEMRRLRFQELLTTTEIGLLQNPPISRERVRQLIGNTGRGFVTARKKKIWAQNKDKTNRELLEALGFSSTTSLYRYREGERHDIVGGGIKINADHVNYVSNLLKLKGIEHELTKARHPYDLHLENGLRVEVLSASPMSHIFPGLNMYNFNTRQEIKGRFCDYFACVTTDTLNVFIVPARLTRLTSPIRFCFPKDYGRISKWLQYHNRFDLLDTV